MISTRSDEPYSSRLFRQLQFLLDDLSLKLEEFELFAVCTGPGSFTGLRVGLAAVKGWGEVYHTPIAAISGLEAVAAQSRCGAGVVIPVLDARRGQVYVGRYRCESGPAAEEWVAESDESVMTPAEFVEYLAILEKKLATTATLGVVTPYPALLANALEEFRKSSAWGRKILVESVSAVLAPPVGRLGIVHARQNRLTDALGLDANYVRRSDAELNWKGKAAL
jgi:tRNA threonylcarbamoyl adenosine modification protein YeaZ